MSIQYFMDTKETIQPGLGFPLYGGIHLMWLAAALVISVCCFFYYRHASASKRLRILRILAVLIYLDEVWKDLMLLIGGRWLPEYLPLHLCSINIYICAFHAWRPTEVKAEFLYAVCMPGALLALLFPAWTMLPAFNFMCIHSFTIHIMLFLYPLLLLAGGHVPRISRLKKTVPALVIGAVLIYLFNKLVGTNFMFLNEPGEGNPLVWFENILGNPGYILGIPILLAVIWTLMYLPFALFSKKKRKKESV